MYIESVPNRKSPPAILLREGKRVGKKVVKRTLANLSNWPENVVEGLRTLLKGGVALGKDDSRLSNHAYPAARPCGGSVGNNKEHWARQDD